MKNNTDSLDKKELLDNIKLLEESIKELDEYSEHLTALTKEKDEEITELDHKIQFLILEQEKEMSSILKSVLTNYTNNNNKQKLEDKDKKIGQLQEEINLIKKANLEQKILIGKYKGSIVYPFFKISSNIGNTKAGQFIQKIIK